MIWWRGGKQVLKNRTMKCSCNMLGWDKAIIQVGNLSGHRETTHKPIKVKKETQQNHTQNNEHKLWSWQNEENPLPKCLTLLLDTWDHVPSSVNASFQSTGNALYKFITSDSVFLTIVQARPTQTPSRSPKKVFVIKNNTTCYPH